MFHRALRHQATSQVGLGEHVVDHALSGLQVLLVARRDLDVERLVHSGHDCLLMMRRQGTYCTASHGEGRVRFRFNRNTVGARKDRRVVDVHILHGEVQLLR